MAELERFEEFFRVFYLKELMTAAAAGKKSIVVDFAVLDRFDPDLADKLLSDPETLLQAARDAIAQIDLAEGSVALEPRFKGLPASHRIRIRNLRSEHIGRFVCIDGIVRRASEVRPEIAVAVFQCPDCGNKMSIKQTERILRSPAGCECGRRSGFALVDRKLFDARWLTVEEPFEIATAEKLGEIPVYLKDDLTAPELQRRCDPGNRLLITGVIKEIRRTSRGRLRTQMDIYIAANHIEPADIEWEEITISAEDEKVIKQLAADPDIYNKLVASIAPSIFGLEEIKKAIVLQLFGGVPHVMPDGIRIRGDIHILLLGDPSVAKSALLKLLASLLPRAKYVSGRGTSAAGLTATVLKDEEFGGGWILEAGAMPLCHKSLISIDEFDKITKEDQIALHEGMEQQTISIAKASIVATLPAQVAVLAGANPKFSRFDQFKSIAEQIDIPDTLLSRFDLKFALRDIPNPEQDRALATYILETRLQPARAKPAIPLELLRKYIAYARRHCSPVMTREAIERITNFYIEMRSLYTGDAVPITLRQNEALMRLAEASAKVRLSPTVEVVDAERAIALMHYSLQQLAYDKSTGKIDIDRTEGVSAAQRSKIHAMLDILDRLGRELGRIIPKEDVLAAASESGINEPEAEELLARLKREGMLFEPRSGYIQKV